MTTQDKKITVADFISKKIAHTDKTQTQISEEIGYPRPNMLTMMKQGRTKVPMQKIVPLARALNADPVHLLRVVMTEYAPEAWAVIEEVLGASIVTKSELDILQIIRSCSGGMDIEPQTEEEKRELMTLASKWAKKANAEVIRH